MSERYTRKSTQGLLNLIYDETLGSIERKILQVKKAKMRPDWKWLESNWLQADKRFSLDINDLCS
jgi:hypothetical protein